MVANIRSGSSPGGALYYNKEKVDKDEAEVLLWQKMLEPYDKCGRLDIDVLRHWDMILFFRYRKKHIVGVIGARKCSGS